MSHYIKRASLRWTRLWDRYRGWRSWSVVGKFSKRHRPFLQSKKERRTIKRLCKYWRSTDLEALSWTSTNGPMLSQVTILVTTHRPQCWTEIFDETWMQSLFLFVVWCDLRSVMGFCKADPSSVLLENFFLCGINSLLFFYQILLQACSENHRWIQWCVNLRGHKFLSNSRSSQILETQ